MCNKESKRYQDCFKLQRNLLLKLGIEHANSIEKYDKIERAADDIGVQWFEEVKDPDVIPDKVLEHVYDKRDEIWK